MYRFKKCFTVVIVVFLFSVAQASEPLFHFNFKNAAAKREVSDTKNNFKCMSNNVGMEVKNGGLRTDYGAEIYIPSQNLSKALREFTMSLWIVPLRTIYSQSRVPLLTKGQLWQNSDFNLLLNGGLPMFFYSSGKKKLCGINVAGRSYGNTFRYADPKIKVYNAENMRFKNNFWAQITVTLNGNKLRIYKNGELLLEKTSAKALPLTLKNKFPIWIGFEKIGSERYCTANLITNDIRFFSKALSGKEIQKLYETDRKNYPASYIRQAPSTHYYAGIIKGFDPDLRNRLKSTDFFVKNIIPESKKLKINKSKVVAHNGRMLLSFNDNLCYPMAGYPALGWFGKQAVRQSAEYSRDFAAAGVNMTFAGASNNSVYWKGEGKYDWSKFDKGYTALVKANPKMKLIITINAFLPKWFVNKYPEELEKYHSRRDSSSKLITWKQTLLASDLWLKTVKQYIYDLVKHIKRTPYGQNVGGFLIVAGDAGEFYWPAIFTGGATGYSENTRIQFSKWLKIKYENSLDKLHKAWNDPSLKFDSIKVPSPEERFRFTFDVFRDMPKSQPVIDFRDFMNDKTFDAIEVMSKATKEASGFKKLVMIYGGYPVLFAGKGHTLQQSGMQTSARLFDCPYVDVVMTPLDYVKRRGGQAGLNINPYNGSSYLHQKLLIHENDLRTHFWQVNNFGRTRDLAETINVVKRGIGYTLVNGAGMEFLAMAGNASFHHEDIMQTIAKGMKTGKEAIKLDNASNAEVAIIFDENCLKYTNCNKSNFMDRNCWGAYSAAIKMGAPFDMYMLEDLANPKMPDYKLYIFLNTFYTDKSIRDTIARKVKRNNAVAVWCYAPGYISQNAYGLENMEKLTGIKFSVDKKIRLRTMTIHDKGNPVTKYVKRISPVNISPVFFADEKGIKTLGTVDGKPALCIKKLQTWTSIYSLVPLNKELLMGLCDYARVHVYNRNFDIFSSNRSFLMIHAAESGDKTISLPVKCNVKECFSGAVTGLNIDKFTINNLQRGETRVYQIQRNK